MTLFAGTRVMVLSVFDSIALIELDLCILDAGILSTTVVCSVIRSGIRFHRRPYLDAAHRCNVPLERIDFFLALSN